MNKDNKKIFGQRLRELRKGKKLTQEEFADMCQLDRSYIASIEQGRRNVSLENIVKIVDALGISLSEFFNW